MYCNQCGKKIAKTSKFCSTCGNPVLEEQEEVSNEPQKSFFDPVQDLKSKIKEIDNLKKPRKKDSTLKAAINVVKGKSSVLDLMFEEDFESKKIEDKKKLILEYTIPKSPEEIIKFSDYVKSQIDLEEKNRGVLAEVWKLKLKEINDYTKANIKESKAREVVKNSYKLEKQKEWRASYRELILAFSIIINIPGIILSFLYWSPIGMFFSFSLFGWCLVITLLAYGGLDEMIKNMKNYSAKKKHAPKELIATFWHLLIPYAAALIVSIIFKSIVLIIVTGVLFGISALSLIFYYSDM